MGISASDARARRLGPCAIPRRAHHFIPLSLAACVTCDGITGLLRVAGLFEGVGWCGLPCLQSVASLVAVLRVTSRVAALCCLAW